MVFFSEKVSFQMSWPNHKSSVLFYVNSIMDSVSQVIPEVSRQLQSFAKGVVYPLGKSETLMSLSNHIVLRPSLPNLIKK